MCASFGVLVQGVKKTYEEHDAGISPSLPHLVSHIRSGAQVIFATPCQRSKCVCAQAAVITYSSSLHARRVRHITCENPGLCITLKARARPRPVHNKTQGFLG